ncbi:hypothetical protein K456DRAFT_1828049, partial [Colletotrichum gloeosporioides 23]
LTLQEACDILAQFREPTWRPDQQVLWTGLGPEYDDVNAYARNNGLQTLRIAMGPLMDPENPACLRSSKSIKESSEYVRGASLIFSWRISQANVTTILTRPPPTRFNPHGRTTYQEIEEPVLKGLLGGQSVGRIMAVHPTVNKAKGFPPYESYPADDGEKWKNAFGMEHPQKNKWRVVKTDKRMTPSKLAFSH